jgi:DNA primase
LQSLSPSQKLSLALKVNKFQMELRTEPGGQDLLDYLAARGISERSIDEFKLGAVLLPEDCEVANGGEPIMLGRIAIPFLTPTGAMALRYMEPPPRRSSAKYWQPEGTKLGIYNTGAIAAGSRKIVITEGEIDCITLHQLGVPVVGMPGASSWKAHYHAIFDGYEEVIIVGDNDETIKYEEDGTPKLMASERFVKKIAEEVPNPRIVMMPRGFDINQLYQEQGGEALLELLKFERAWR